MKTLSLDVQDMTSSVLHVSMIGSRTWAHLLGYFLYDPSTHEAFESTSVVFVEVLINFAKFGNVLYVPEVGVFIVDAFVYYGVRHYLKKKHKWLNFVLKEAVAKLDSIAVQNLKRLIATCWSFSLPSKCREGNFLSFFLHRHFLLNSCIQG
jgi:hypothetical protein